MSIYSGFATRFQQQSYDHCLDSLLYILQKRIIKFYLNQQADEEKFISLVMKLHGQMKNMERNKYLEPKSSQAMGQLVRFMQVFLDNSPQSLSDEKHKEEQGEADRNESIREVSNPTRKKSIYWVERPAVESSSNKGSEQDIKTINSNNYDVSINEGIIELRKTSYNPAHLRGIKIKNGSKSNLSRQKRTQKQLAEVKPPKNRSVSGYIHDKPLVQSKMTHYGQSFRQQTEHLHQKRRNKSHHKVNQADIDVLQGNHNEMEVADIIRQYVIKAKKGHLQGRLKSDERSLNGKLHDF